MRNLFVLLTVIYSSVCLAGFYDVVEKDIDGKEYKLATLKDKVVLVVNIASQCGYTDQLSELQKLHQKYAAKGLVVLGVPTNDFGGQTPEDDKGMKEFCSRKYQVNFPLLTKKTVQGKEMRPLYQFLTKQTDKKFQGDIGWNFEKFLVNKQGTVIGRYSSKIKPDSKEVTDLIEKNL